MKQWFAYAAAPVDFRWQHLHTMNQVLSSMAAGDIEPAVDDYDSAAVMTFHRSWESARLAAMAAGWNGELRLKPRVFWVPVGSTFEMGFAIKQDHCGVTYVVSPVPMPWLECQSKVETTTG